MDNKQIKTGYVPDKIEKEHWILGVNSQLPQIILRPNGQWTDFLPKGEQQRKQFETFNCTSFNTLNPVEILFEEMFKLERNFSDRFTGISADTKPPGNSPQVVAEAIRIYGLIDDLLLSFDDLLTSWQEYYSPNPLTTEFLAEGKKFLQKYSFGHEWVFTQDTGNEIGRMKQALQYSPLGASVYAWVQDVNGLYVNPTKEQDVHWTCVAGYVEGKYWIIFDSYQPFIKHLAWDFPFGQVKRYSLVKNVIAQPIKKKSFLGRIYTTIGKYWRLITDPGSLGAERSTQWKVTRKLHLERYPLCAVCGKKGTFLNPLNCHHKYPFHLYPDKENDPQNLISLCRDDHFIFGHLKNFSSFNKDIDKDAALWKEKILKRP